MKSYFAVTGIVMFNDKILILKKHPDDRNYPNYWSFVSGFVKEFEAGEDTMMREMKEETGLDGEIVKTGEVIEAFDEKNNKTWVVKPFLLKVNSDKVKLCHENTDFKWVTLEELMTVKFVPGLKQDLKSVGLL